MFRLVRRLRDSSKLKNILLMFFSLIVLQICGLIMCYENLTFRLPRDVVPVSYVLQLHPDFGTELFNGQIAIAIDIHGERQFIALHSKDLRITAIKLTKYHVTNTRITEIGDMFIMKIFTINEYEMMIIETRNIISPGKYILRFRFNGKLSKDGIGFFVNSYIDPHTGELRKIIATRFEPTYARRAFPCFDEPHFKAIFDIRLIQPNLEGYLSLSNMPSQYLDQAAPKLELTTVYFEPSPPMSTYLVAFFMGDFVNETTFISKRWNTPDLIRLSAWTMMEYTVNLDLVLHMAFRSLELYMRLFRSNCPLPKIDMVAIPGFKLGSMENWGLVTYGEPSVLYHDRSNSVTELKITTNRIAYGLIHTWFGSLVTINWWNDIWLVKSFATYMQYYTTNWAFPDWKEHNNFLVEAKFPSMMRDALLSSQPIAQSYGSPKEIDKLIHSIPYQKGASIIRMLIHIMGESNFFNGVAYYLQSYQFNSAFVENFASTLQRFHSDSKENLTQFVKTWTTQSGFPVLNVERINDMYFINQSRFVWNDGTFYNKFDSPYLYKWDIPIFYMTNISNITKRVFIPYNSTSVRLVVDEQVTWVKFNTNSIGYYTVNYDIRTWEIFSEILGTMPEKILTLDRMDLINDAFINADAGRTPYHVPMSMLRCMQFETDHTSWQFVSDKLLSIHTMLRGTEIFDEFEGFVKNLISSIYKIVGWSTHPINSFPDRRLRITILKLACAVGTENSVEEVTQRFRFWIDDPHTRPHPDMKEIIYYYGMSIAGGRDDWNIVYNLFVTELDPQERHKLIVCLTAIQNPWILMRFLETAKNFMSPDEYLKTIHAATLNPTGALVVWDFYKTNWNFLSSRYGNDERFVRLIISVTSKFRETDKLFQILQFFGKHPNGELTAIARNEASEIVRNNIAWMERNYEQIRNWLSASRGQFFS